MREGVKHLQGGRTFCSDSGAVLPEASCLSQPRRTDRPAHAGGPSAEEEGNGEEKGVNADLGICR